MVKLFTRIAVAASALIIGATAPALARADTCVGDAHASCVAVNGSKLHVNWIKRALRDVWAVIDTLCPSGTDRQTDTLRTIHADLHRRD